LNIGDVGNAKSKLNKLVEGNNV